MSTVVDFHTLIKSLNPECLIGKLCLILGSYELNCPLETKKSDPNWSSVVDHSSCLFSLDWLLTVGCSLPWCSEWGGLGLAWAGPASQVRLHAAVCGSGLDPGGCIRYQTAAGGSSCWHSFPLEKTHASRSNLFFVDACVNPLYCMCVRTLSYQDHWFENSSFRFSS